MLIYTVKPGDTVDSIAAAYGIPVSTIVYQNQIPYPYRLAIGEALLLPTPAGISSPRSTIYAGGYAYPFISPWVLRETLPYLSYLYIFSYGFTMEGELIEPLLDDAWMIEAARAFGTAPILTLTPFGPDGRFNNSLISQVVNDLDARRRLKDAIVEQITARGFQGLDIDFEYILAEDRDAFVDFVAYMQEAVSALGYPTSVALAPKTSDTQTGLLYEGKDYRRLGETADYVLLMTYEWGYTYGPPMAVAPLDKVRQVVEYALSQIPAEKLILGIPNYGYDWQLPYERGVTRAQTIGNVQAVDLAVENGTLIRYAQTAQSPWFTYKKSGMDHVVWFEDVRSIQAKWKLVQELDLAGAWYWNLMRKFRGNWLMLESPDAGRNT